jgi:hypothetical protein
MRSGMNARMGRPPSHDGPRYCRADDCRRRIGLPAHGRSNGIRLAIKSPFKLSARSRRRVGHHMSRFFYRVAWKVRHGYRDSNFPRYSRFCSQPLPCTRYPRREAPPSNGSHPIQNSPYREMINASEFGNERPRHINWTTLLSLAIENHALSEK